jgi:hypothetical protein
MYAAKLEVSVRVFGVTSTSEASETILTSMS